jgi:hypothetical protein
MPQAAMGSGGGPAVSLASLLHQGTRVFAGRSTDSFDSLSHEPKSGLRFISMVFPTHCR